MPATRYFALTFGLALAAIAQATAPSYAAVSIKPAAPNQGGHGITNGPEGGLRCFNDTVTFLISVAYDIEEYQIVGAPGWASTDRYDVTFTAGEGESASHSGQIDAAEASYVIREKLRLRQVLHDRFGLVLHQDTRAMPVYELTQIKPQLKAAPEDEPSSFQSTAEGHLTATATPLSMLTRFLSRTLEHPVNDSTGLTGLYDFTLTWDPTFTSLDEGPPQPPASGAAAPSIFGALNAQLGLKLESKQGPAQSYVIDKIEKPAGN